MRIYEILAGGAIPYIRDLDSVPSGALAFLNKSLLQDALSLPGIVPEELRLDKFAFDFDKYRRAAAELLRHTQQHVWVDF